METIQFTFQANQARSIYQYKKWKIKVLKCNADIFFNKQCLAKKIIPNYANVKKTHTTGWKLSNLSNLKK